MIENLKSSIRLPVQQLMLKNYSWRTLGKDGALDKIFSLAEGNNKTFINYSLLTAFSILEKFASLYFISNVGSGTIEKLDTSILNIFTDAPGYKINTIFHFIRGKYPFQKATAPETINDVVFQSNHELHSKNDFEGPDKSLYQLIVVNLFYLSVLPKSS